MTDSLDDSRESQRGDESSPSANKPMPPPARDEVPALVRNLKAADANVRAGAAESLRRFARAEAELFQPTHAERELASLGLKIASLVVTLVFLAVAIVKVLLAINR